MVFANNLQYFPEIINATVRGFVCLEDLFAINKMQVNLRGLLLHSLKPEICYICWKGGML